MARKRRVKGRRENPCLCSKPLGEKLPLVFGDEGRRGLGHEAFKSILVKKSQAAAMAPDPQSEVGDPPESGKLGQGPSPMTKDTIKVVC